MVEPHPTEVGQTKNVKFCFSHTNGNTCQWHTLGEVTKCGEDDFVYKLSDVPKCRMRYCAVI